MRCYGRRVCGIAAAGISSVAAHHSTTMFDHSKTLTINGTVVELRWVNPHVSLSSTAPSRSGRGAGVWVMEMTSPGNLVRAGGWRRDAVKPGDKVEVDFSPLRDAEKQGGARKSSPWSRPARSSRPTSASRRRRVSSDAAARLSSAPVDAFAPRDAGRACRLAACARWHRRRGAERRPLPPPKDTIFARKILMGAIDMNMDEIETMLAPDGTLEARRGAASTPISISIMLMSFPHMFPPSTNQWTAGADRDPATDTFASPDVWSEFCGFLSARAGGFEARLRGQPRQARRRVQSI